MLEIGEKVKATCKDGDVYIGILTRVCIGMDPKDRTQACIFLLESNGDDEEESDAPSQNATYGNAMLMCNDLSSISNTDDSPGLYPFIRPAK